MSVKLPNMVRLATAHLLLRDFTLADAAAYFAYRSLPEVTHYVAEPALITVHEAEAVLARIIGRQFATPRRHLLLAITLPAAGRQVIGEVGLETLPDDDLAAELGVMLAPAFWRQGYAFEAAQAILQYGREEAGWQRITATCDVDNEASARILTRLGLRQTAYLPRHYRKGEGWRHSLQFELSA